MTEFDGERVRARLLTGGFVQVKALAGCDTEAALVTMSEAFEFVGSLLDPPMAVHTPPVVVAE